MLLRISGSRLDFDVSFNQRCYSRANRFLGNVHGSFEFRSIQALEAGGQGRFAMRFRQRHTKVKGFKQYFRAVYDVTGTVGKSRASGGFSAVSQYYMLSGTPLGTCRTGRLGWSAKLRR